MGYGLVIKKSLRDKKMTIKKLSDETGVSVQTLYSIIKRDNKRISQLVFEKIDSVLDIRNIETFDDVATTTGEKIKKARTNKRMTIRDVAKNVGVSFQQVSQWESGERNPKLENIVKLSHALEINPMELLPDWFLDEASKYATP